MVRRDEYDVGREGAANEIEKVEEEELEGDKGLIVERGEGDAVLSRYEVGDGGREEGEGDEEN